MIEKIRIQKALGAAGIASRRDIEQMIVEKRIRVNGKTVAELGTKIDPMRDEVYVDGKKVKANMSDGERLYFLLHKPSLFLTTTRDDRGRKTVMDLVKGATDGRIFPVGRLDYDAQGALLLTNDGEMANKLTHPKSNVPKTYLVKVKGVPAPEKLQKLRQGIYLEDGPTGPAKIEVVGKAKINTWVEIVLSEGRNRQVKRMFRRIKHPVMKLIRTDFAGLRLDGLEIGQYRTLSQREITRLASV